MVAQYDLKGLVTSSSVRIPFGNGSKTRLWMLSMLLGKSTPPISSRRRWKTVPIFAASETLSWFTFLTLWMTHCWISTTLVNFPPNLLWLPPLSVLLVNVPLTWPPLRPLLSVIPCQTFLTFAVLVDISFGSIIAWFLLVFFSRASPHCGRPPLSFLISVQAYPWLS